MRIGHDLSREEIRERIALRWKDVAGLPVPRWTVICPECGSAAVFIRRYNFHRVRQSPEPERVDVLMKCAVCSYGTFGFGLVWPRPDGVTSNVVHWREARKMMEADR